MERSRSCETSLGLISALRGEVDSRRDCLGQSEEGFPRQMGFWTSTCIRISERGSQTNHAIVLPGKMKNMIEMRVIVDEI